MLSPLSPDHLPSVKETRKRIADQLESEKLDNNPKPHLRRTSHELKTRQRQRRTALQAQWQHMEIVQRAERMSLHAAQKKERENPFARAAMAVFGLFDRVPVLRTVLGPLYKNPAVNIEERHRQQNDMLERRYQRERSGLERRQKALSQVEARENKSLARDQRRIKGAAYDEAVKTRERAEEFRDAAEGRAREQGQGMEKPEERKEGQKHKRPRGYGYRPS